MTDIYTIYMATNLINGKHYIGFASSWPKRKHVHHYETFNESNKSYGTYFHNSIRKYGWDNFEWKILYQSKDKGHTLKVMEPYFIKEYVTFFREGNGYNMTPGGEGRLGHIPWNKNKKLSDEIIAKMKKPKGKSRKLTKEHIEKIRLSKIGKPRRVSSSKKLAHISEHYH